MRVLLAVLAALLSACMPAYAAPPLTQYSGKFVLGNGGKLGSYDVVTTSAPGALLHVSSSNSRYFATPDEKAVWLGGEHTWTNKISWSGDGAPFDFAAYLTFMVNNGQNLVRYWSWDSVLDPQHGTPNYVPFNRSSTSGEYDGGNKFNLTSYNSAYFDHIVSDTDAAKARGIYVMVMLLFDWDQGYNIWNSDPWNGNNNVNGTSNSDTVNGECTDSTTVARQEDYIAHTLDVLATKTNVLYEIANEPINTYNGVACMGTLTDFIHAYETSHGYLHHPVVMTASYPGANQTSTNGWLFSFNAEGVSPHGWQNYQSNPPIASGAKVQLQDTDHTFGIGSGSGGADWVWQQFMRGGNVLLMSDMRNTGMTGLWNVSDSGNIQFQDTSRAGLKAVRAAVNLVDMTTMVPSTSACSTTYCLSDNTTFRYIAYTSGSGSFTVNLSLATGRTLNVKWINASTGAITSSGTVPGGNSAQLFAPPFSGAALVLAAP